MKARVELEKQHQSYSKWIQERLKKDLEFGPDVPWIFKYPKSKAI